MRAGRARGDCRQVINERGLDTEVLSVCDGAAVITNRLSERKRRKGARSQVLPIEECGSPPPQDVAPERAHTGGPQKNDDLPHLIKQS
jgi:hypothetical protein